MLIINFHFFRILLHLAHTVTTNFVSVATFKIEREKVGSQCIRRVNVSSGGPYIYLYLSYYYQALQYTVPGMYNIVCTDSSQC